jgi:hypothetical protein
VKYLMLVYGNEQIWGDPTVDFAAMVGEVDAFNAALTESGEMVVVEGVAAVPRAVRSNGGVPVVTDGPYLEAKEHVGSFFILDVRDEARALEIARDYPCLRYLPAGGVEVWPLMVPGAPDA